MNFVISLERTPVRLETFLKNNGHIKFEVFHAIDGSTLVPLGNYKRGGMGNAMSHIGLWKQCIEMDEPITVCEDDAILHAQFEQKKLDYAKCNYDFICWGWNFDAHLWASPMPFLSPIQMIFNQNSMRANKFEYLKSPLETILMDLHLSNGTICYTITPKGAKKFLNICYPLKSKVSVNIPNIGIVSINPAGLDSAMPDAYQKTKSVVCFPPLAVSDNDHATSTVQNA